MTHTHHPGLVALWKIKLTRRHYVEVFVWESLDCMYLAGDYNVAHYKPEHMNENNNNEHTYLAYAAAMIQAVPNSKGRIKAPRKFGEIHLAQGRYHVGLVSHEVAHMMAFWATYKGWEIYDRDNEKFAWITGELNRQIWNAHYKQFP